MSGFEHFARDAIEIEREMLKRGLMMGVDWSDEPTVRGLARETLAGGAVHTNALLRDDDPKLRAKGELFAFAALMLRVMKASAVAGVHTHGGVVWKAFGRALIEESDGRHGGRPGRGAGRSGER